MTVQIKIQDQGFIATSLVPLELVLVSPTENGLNFHSTVQTKASVVMFELITMVYKDGGLLKNRAP